MKREKLFLSTVGMDAARVAKCHGLGLEIAEFCTAANMDDPENPWAKAARENAASVERILFHAPYNELFPCAIDPLARDLARHRYRQALTLAREMGAGKTVIHSGYAPNFYYDVWHVSQGVEFWSAFVKELPEDTVICMENVLEAQPEPLLEILEGVHDPRLRCCLDVGHANAYSGRDNLQWLELLAPYITHFHIHNNHGEMDEHLQLDEGTIEMEAFLHRAQVLCPDATYTLELSRPEHSVLWLREKGLLV